MKRKMSSTDSEDSKYWVDWFLTLRGNEFFCEVDEEFLTDKFNLTGLNNEVPYFQQALDLINDSLDDEFDLATRADIDKAAQQLYGLIHARFVLTNRGLQKIGEKYKRGDFGRCPRVLCNQHQVLPLGLSDIPKAKTVKIYCPKCEDVYHPRSARHANLDGAHFGTSLPHILFQVFPSLIPPKTQEKFVPRIFGFKIHPSSQLYQKGAANAEGQANGSLQNDAGD